MSHSDARSESSDSAQPIPAVEVGVEVEVVVGVEVGVVVGVGVEVEVVVEVGVEVVGGVVVVVGVEVGVEMTERGEAVVRDSARLFAEVAALYVEDIPASHMEEFKRRLEARVMYALWAATFDTFENVLGNPMEGREAGL